MSSSSSAPTAKKKSSDNSALKRPPPVETSGSGTMDSFAPVMRGLFSPPAHQQIAMVPSKSNWDLAEQRQLDRLVRLLGSNSGESLLSRSTKIAAHLSNKSIREVAFRLKMMEEDADRSRRGKPVQAAAVDEIDRSLSRLDEILAKLALLLYGVGEARTSEQRQEICELMHEFAGITQNTKLGLEFLNARVPTALVLLAEIPPLPPTQQQHVVASSLPSMPSEQSDSN